MQPDSLSVQALNEVMQRFEEFCQHREGGEAHQERSSLFVVDHTHALPFHQRYFGGEKAWVVASTAALLTSYLRRGVQGALMKETAPAFTACFQKIVICFFSSPSLESDTLLKQWAGCLAPEGKLYFLMLGEMTFCEVVAQAEETSTSVPHHLFLSRCALNWIGDCHVQTDEMWVRLQAPSFPTRTFLSQLILKKEDPRVLTPQMTPPLASLTLHFVCGEMQKVEKSQDI